MEEAQQELSEAQKSFHKNALDWFDFETRMRKLIHELLAPTVKRSHEDKEIVSKLKSIVMDHNKRLKPIEFALYKSEEPTDAFEKMYQRMTEIESKRIEEETVLKHQMVNLKEYVDNFQIQFDKATNERKELRKIIQVCDENIETITKKMIEQHQKQQDEKLLMMTELTSEINKLREKINGLDLMTATNKTHVDSCRITVEHLEGLVDRFQDRNESFRIELDSIRRAKLENSRFEQKTQKFDEQIKVIKVVLENTLNEFKSVENFTSKYLPIKVQNQILDILCIFLSKKDRRKVEAVLKNKLKEFHDAIIEDDGNSNINDQIAKLQDGMKATDSRYDFPKIDRSGIDKTMTIVNNVSEILESSRTKNKRLYTYRDKEIKKVGSSEDNEISILEENIIDEEIKDEDSKTQQKSQFVNGDDKDGKKRVIVMQKSSANLFDEIKNDNTEKSSQSSKLIVKEVGAQKSAKVIQTTPQLSEDKNRSRISTLEDAADPEKELNVNAFKNAISKTEENKKVSIKVKKEVKEKEELDNLNQSSISEIKENYSLHDYSDEDEKDTNNLLLEQALKEQFEVYSKSANEMIINRISERIKGYDSEVEEKIKVSSIKILAEVKECNEYISTLHNEIDSKSAKFKEDLNPIIKDMNQLHQLLIQCTDENRMLFSNLKIVALFCTDIFDMTTLIYELNRQSELDSSRYGRNSINTMNQDNSMFSPDSFATQNKPKMPDLAEKGVASINKNIKILKEALESQKEPKTSEEYGIAAKDKFKHDRKVHLTTTNLTNMLKLPNLSLLSSEISFKNRIYTRNECFEMLTEMIDKGKEKKTSLIFDHIHESRLETMDDSTKKNQSLMKSTSRLKDTITKARKISGRVTPSLKPSKLSKLIPYGSEEKDISTSIFPQIYSISPRVKN